MHVNEDKTNGKEVIASSEFLSKLKRKVAGGKNTKKSWNSIRILLVATGLVVSAFITSWYPVAGSGDKCTNGNCPKPLFWLTESSIPEPNYKDFPCGYVKDTCDGVTNLAFHEISWQYFLWLTEMVTVEGNDVLRFETFHNDASINLEKQDKEGLTHILGGIQQAGSNSVLVDDNGRAVYTTMMIDNTYRDWIVENKLNTVKGLQEFPASLNFPVGSMSIKAAWKIIPEGESLKGAYTRTSKLYTVVDVNQVLTTSDNTENPKTFEATVALVGLHIAVVIKDHPEFIWATFEHDQNAPNFIDNTTPPSDKDFTFYKAGTDASSCNSAGFHTESVDPITQIISGYMASPTTQVYRRYEFGGGSIGNQTNIGILNNKVRIGLPDNIYAQNYHEVGAVWFDLDKGALRPNWSLTSDSTLQTGSKTLSSSVIETFTQDPQQQNSCFSCHNTMPIYTVAGEKLEGKNALTSHILLKNYLEKLNPTAEGKLSIER